MIMKNFLRCLLPLIFFYSLQGFAQVEGDYVIYGSHSKYGQYIGQGWIRKGVVQRVIRYEDYKYEDHAVEEIWTGQSNENLIFSLKQSNILTSFNGYAPNDESFKKPISVTLANDVFDKQTSFNISGDQASEEWSYRGVVNNSPFWTDLRNKTEAIGKEKKFIKFVSKIGYIEKVIDLYREHPALADYKERPEFKAATHYIYRDRTDAGFYEQNSDVLRITNKTTNPLSLAEALMKKNAYGKSLGEKEKLLRSETMKYNFNKAGMLETGIVDEKDNQIGKMTEYDSALWTAMFGWAELMRFKVTKDPEALKNFKTVLEAELTLLEIVNDPKEFARSLAISPVGENLGEGWVQGEGKFAHLKWRQGGNNDMVKGVFITLILAHQVVKPDEVALIQRIQKNVLKLPGLKAADDSTGGNYGVAEGIVALWHKDEKRVAKFHKKVFSFINSLGKINQVGTGLYYGGIADWSGIHLHMVSTFCQLLASRELQTVFTDEKTTSKLKELQAGGEKELIDMYEMYKNTRRDFLPIMISAYIPEFKLDPKYNAETEEAVWILKEIPAPRFFGHGKADLTKLPDWSYSAWPRQPWKAIAGFRKLRENFDVFTLQQGAYGYPLYEGLAWSCTYMWKNSPYGSSYESNPAVKIFSADYMLVYWASRMSGIITAED
jgi:hypothetical protein